MTEKIMPTKQAITENQETQIYWNQAQKSRSIKYSTGSVLHIINTEKLASLPAEEIFAEELYEQGNEAWNEFFTNNPHVTLNFILAEFPDNLNFLNFFFGNKNKYFSLASFGKGDVDFTRARFGEGNVNFQGADFGEGNVDFTLAKFGEGDVNFMWARFGEGNVDFSWAEFGEGNVNFMCTRFGEGNVDFQKAKFGEGNVNFKQANLEKGNVDFSYIRYHKTSFDFSYFKFPDNFYFTTDKTNKNTENKVTYNNVLRELKFFGCAFNKLCVIDIRSDIKNEKKPPIIVDFTNTLFNYHFSLEDLDFDEDIIFTKYKKYKEWDKKKNNNPQSKDDDDKDFKDKDFKDKVFENYPARALRLKKLAKNNDNISLALKCHAVEMRMRRQDYNIFLTLFHKIYDQVSHYGQSILRPLAGIFGTLFIFSHVYAIMSSSTFWQYIKSILNLQFNQDAFTLAFHNLIGSLSPLREQKEAILQQLYDDAPYDLLINTVQVFNAASGLTFLFLLALGIRNNLKY